MRDNKSLNNIKIAVMVLLVIMMAREIYWEYTYNKASISLEHLEDERYSDIVEIIGEVEDAYNKYYVGDVDEITSDDLALAVGNAVVTLYGDPYGAYLTPELLRETTLEAYNELYGIGVYVRLENSDEGKYVWVEDVYEGSPAEKAGIQRGDFIVRVEDTIINEDTDLNGIADLIKGEVGTSVEIEITKGSLDGERKVLNIVRDKVTTESIRYEYLEDNIGYLRIYSFTGSTYGEVKACLKEFKTQGIDKLIIDVRNNSGGLEDSVCDTIGLFISRGLILEERGKDGELGKKFYADGSYIGFDSIICLVNDSTASAAELFTASLQLDGKAQVVGEVTYGKGTVCSMYEIEHGGLYISTERYYLRNGECIEGIGVIPDIEVEMPEELRYTYYRLDKSEDVQLQTALELLK